MTLQIALRKRPRKKTKVAVFLKKQRSKPYQATMKKKKPMLTHRLSIVQPLMAYGKKLPTTAN